MLLLHNIPGKLKNEFAHSRKGRERGARFVYSPVAIIIPFTSSKTSNLLRCLRGFFGFTRIAKKRYYTFAASPKIQRHRLWRCVWKMIPAPLTDDRLLPAIDYYINPKTGKKIFVFAKIFGHAAKQNQSRYPWAQNIAAGLLKIVKGRRACLPLSHRFYHLKKNIESGTAFKTKPEQAAGMVTGIAGAFRKVRVPAIMDSWFGNNGLFKPLHQKPGTRFDMISRLRSSSSVFQLPGPRLKKGRGRPKKYGKKLGSASTSVW